jgi:hypothetical protein
MNRFDVPMRPRRPLVAALALLTWMVGAVSAQTTAAPPSAAGAPAATLEAMSWLEGCWTGAVNEREFREQWSPPRGGMMLGLGHTVHQGKTQSHEFLRLETRPDGIYYVALPSDQRPAAFKLVGTAVDDKDAVFTFENPEHDFPQRIQYRRGTEGWLYATIEGKLKGEDRKVIYPMRRVSCDTGEQLRK